MIPAPALTLADLRALRARYGGTLTETRGGWMLVGAKFAGQPVTLGPVVEAVSAR